MRTTTRRSAVGRIHRVHDEVHDHLLEVHAIAEHRGNVVVGVDHELDLPILRLGMEYLGSTSATTPLIADGRRRQLTLGEQGAQARHDLARAEICETHVRKNLPHGVEFDLAGPEQGVRGFRVRRIARGRLAHLVSH